MSKGIWKPEKDLCRCCLAEGFFHNLSEPGHHLGQNVLYLDMLQSSFDIKDATSFKRQVLQCEERFENMFQNSLKGLSLEIEVKQEQPEKSSEVMSLEIEIKEEPPDQHEDENLAGHDLPPLVPLSKQNEKESQKEPRDESKKVQIEKSLKTSKGVHHEDKEGAKSYRVYKRYSGEDLKRAIRLVLEHRVPRSEAARRFNIPLRTFATKLRAAEDQNTPKAGQDPPPIVKKEILPENQDASHSETPTRCTEHPPQDIQTTNSNHRSNDKSALRRERDRRYRERNQEKINQRKRENRQKRSLQPADSRPNDNRIQPTQHDGSSKQMYKHILRKERDRKYRERHRAVINQRNKESRLRKLNVHLSPTDACIDDSKIKRYRFYEEIQTILKYTNATPFKTKKGQYFCAYCSTNIQDTDEFRIHTRNQHEKERFENVESLMRPVYLNEVMKLDILDLQCTVCGLELDWIGMLQHLQDVHGEILDEARSKVIPYVLSDSLKCAFCNEESFHFYKLDYHMNLHYRNYICGDCGETFVTKNRLKKHIPTHNIRELPCPECGKVFALEIYRKKHYEAVHKRKKKIKCPYCPEMFLGKYNRHLHLLDVHDVEVEVISCEYCDAKFTWKPYYFKHKKIQHKKPDKKIQCQICNKMFHEKHKLRNHMDWHNGVGHVCEICNKKFSSKWYLQKHVSKHEGNHVT